MGAGRGSGKLPLFTRRAILGHAVKWSVGMSAASVSGFLLEPMMVPAADGPSVALGTLAYRRRFNVKDSPYGAIGDGVVDDGPAIQAAIDDAARAGGGVVILPAGTYLLNSVQWQTGVRAYLLNYFSGIAIVGAGRNLTTLRAGPGLPNETRILSANSADGTRRVSDVHLQDFTVDGSAAQQPDARCMVGISNVWTDGVTLMGVRVQRVKGTPGAQGEGVGFDSYFATNHQYVDCEAVQNGAATGSGFGATYARDIAYRNCRASGSAHWMGFTVFKSESVEYQDCHGALNAQRGLNCEQSKSVRYVNCRAGGQAASNLGDGIYVYQSSNVDVIDCISNSNLNGLLNNGSSVRVIRGDFSQNRSAGMAFVSQTDWDNTRLDEPPAVSTNGLASVLIEGQPQVIEGMS